MTEQRLRFWVPIGVIAGCSLIAAILIAVRAPIESSEILDIAPRVRVLNVSQETVNLTVETHGTVTPRTESELIPEVSGPVISVSPQLVSGGFFQKGDVLLEIDRRDYQTALDRAKAVRLRTRSEHARAKKELGRQEKLRASGAASQARFDDATNAAQIAAAALQEARALLEQAERDLERTRVLAPFTGRVREENVGVGQFVNRGNSVAKLYATDFVEIRLPVPDQQLAFLDLQLAGVAASDQTGPRVKLHASFAGGEYTWEGWVHRTEGEIDPRTRTGNVVP
ncbi:MAG: efflux RND transporter periplasmic adaptor subunit, partial [Myxococcales bacterium]|nr:efflux RND transporter periplasmic adaptor subunit [Myxococcales bacterium]